MTTKPFFSVFPDLKVSDDVRSLFEDANIKEITLKKRDNMLKISFQCDHLISRVDTWRMERTIREQLFSKRFVKIRFQESYHLSEQYNLKYLMEHYMKSFLFELKGKGEVIFNVVRKGDYKVSDNVITFYFEDTFVNRNKAPEIKDFFETILKNRFSIDAKVGFDFSKTIDQSLKMESNYRLQQEIHTIVEHADTVEKEQKEEKKARKKAAVTKKEHTFKKKPKYSDDPTLLYGRNCDGELMEIKDIYDEIGEVVVHGQITFLETREIRNEKTIIIFHITDLQIRSVVRFLFEMNSFRIFWTGSKKVSSIVSKQLQCMINLIMRLHLVQSQELKLSQILGKNVRIHRWRNVWNYIFIL